MGGFEGLQLQGTDHIHIVDPESRIFREAIRAWIPEFIIRQFSGQLQVLLITCLTVHFKGPDTKNVIIHMPRTWCTFSFQKGGIACFQLLQDAFVIDGF